MKLNKYIDHTLLKPEATLKQIEKLCIEAKEYKFNSVCVNGCFARIVTDLLQGSEVRTCVVIGFPLGATCTDVKAFESRLAIENGASELDMVINIGALKDKDYEYVLEDIKAVVEEAEDSAYVKVIIETALLTEEGENKACELALEAGAEFVKTSTGFNGKGARVEDVALMKKVVGKKAEVKASGGIKTREDALKMIEAGATRIGTSSGVKILLDND